MSTVGTANLTFKLSGDVTCRGESSNAAVPDCRVSTSTKRQVVILSQTRGGHQLKSMRNNAAIETGAHKAQNNILNSIYSFYLFEQRVSAEFLHPDLSGAQVPHILIHDRLHVHGAVQTALQLAEQRRQGPWQEARLSTTACKTEVET